MPPYDISVHCKDCGVDHPVLLRLHIDDVSDRKQSIADLFDGRSVLHRLRQFEGTKHSAPKRVGKFYLKMIAIFS